MPFSLGPVMDALAAAVTTAGYTDQVYGFPVPNPNVPCMFVGFPTRFDFDATFKRGADEATFPLFFIVGKIDQLTARDALSSIIDKAKGTAAALDGLSLGGLVSSTQVRDVKIVTVVIGNPGLDYLAAEFTVDVLG